MGGGATGLELGSCPLRVFTARLRVRRWLLGLLDRPSRRAVCAGVFQCRRLCAAGVLLLAGSGHRPGSVRRFRFLRPRYQHYYFGDYYAANYQTAGFYPSYSYNSGGFGYDPLYAHALAASPRWPVGAPRRGRLQEPPRSRGCPTAAHVGCPKSAARVRRAPRSGALRWLCHSLSLQRAKPVRCDSSRSIRWREKRWVSAVKRCSDSARSGKNWRPEWRRPSAAVLGKGLAPAKVTLPRSPLVAKPIAELDKGHAPPQMLAAPKPDLKVEPKPQATRSPQQPQAQPRVEHPACQPQPRVEHAAPPPQSPVEHAAPPPQPRVEHAAPPPAPHPAPQPAAGRPAAGPNQDKQRDQGKGKN